MRRRAGLVLTLAGVAAAALPAAPAAASRTRTPVRIAEPSPGNATVAGFDLRIVKRTAKGAGARIAAVKLPPGVSVVAVVGKQKRSDRVRGVIVVLRRATAVAAHAAAAVVTVDLRHAAIPAGFRTTLKLAQRRNVLDPGRAFRCGSYFKSSDLRGALSLGGPALQGLPIRDAIADACLSAGSRAPYPGENTLRAALNARSGFLTFQRNAQQPAELDGSASFNYPVGGFAVLADKAHTIGACSSPVATCQLLTKRHASDYALFTLTSSPAARDTPLAFAISISPNPTAAVPFEFFGLSPAGARFGPLLTSGP